MDIDGNTALHFAVAGHNMEIAEELLLNNADIEAKNKVYRSTTFIYKIWEIHVLCFFFFFSHKHYISNMYTAYYISGQVATERTPKPSQEGLKRCHVHRKVEALPASYPFTPELRTPC